MKRANHGIHEPNAAEHADRASSATQKLARHLSMRCLQLVHRRTLQSIEPQKTQPAIVHNIFVPDVRRSLHEVSWLTRGSSD